jgi:hypothetical protein
LGIGIGYRTSQQMDFCGCHQLQHAAYEVLLLGSLLHDKFVKKLPQYSKFRGYRINDAAAASERMDNDLRYYVNRCASVLSASA